jgi:hypothetical protein
MNSCTIMNSNSDSETRVDFGLQGSHLHQFNFVCVRKPQAFTSSIIHLCMDALDDNQLSSSPGVLLFLSPPIHRDNYCALLILNI